MFSLLDSKKNLQKNYATNKTVLCKFEGFSKLLSLNLNGYGTKFKNVFRSNLIVVNIFCEIGWTVPLEKCWCSKETYWVYISLL